MWSFDLNRFAVVCGRWIAVAVILLGIVEFLDGVCAVGYLDVASLCLVVEIEVGIGPTSFCKV